MSKNNRIYIDKEALSALSLLKSGLLYPVIDPMRRSEMLEINKTGFYKNFSFSCPFLFNPSGKRNQDLIKSAKEGDNFTLVCDDIPCGEIIVKESFAIDLEMRASQMGISVQKESAMKRQGEFALSGHIKLFDNPLDLQKRTVANKINELNPKNISGLFFNINPLHRVHEKLIRDELEKTDLMIIFLLKNYHDDFLDFDTRKVCINYVLDNYIMSEKIIVVELDYTYLFFGDNRHILYWLIASNFGCTSILLGQNHAHLGMYFDNEMTYNIFSSLKGVQIDVRILDEYVYCMTCGVITSLKTCPHGRHHHISYKPEVILNFFRLGIMPPTILVRKEISAIILNRLYGENNADLLRPIYYEILPNMGIYSDDITNDFYNKLIDLYRIHH
ncbi:MAG: sulfate adenylyltransferase [Helicobacter sp.]|nr:sulfate adenylyltransferase [Helicobacter sp.]